MTPKTPYLLRAFHDWLEDNGFTAYLVVNVDYPNVVAPKEYAQDGRLTLAVSHNATGNLLIENDAMSFAARFAGVSRDLWIPMGAILAIYAKEDPSQMLMFDPNEYKDADLPPAKKSGLKLVK